MRIELKKLCLLAGISLSISFLGSAHLVHAGSLEDQLQQQYEEAIAEGDTARAAEIAEMLGSVAPVTTNQLPERERTTTSAPAPSTVREPDTRASVRLSSIDYDEGLVTATIINTSSNPAENIVLEWTVPGHPSPVLSNDNREYISSMGGNDRIELTLFDSVFTDEYLQQGSVSRRFRPRGEIDCSNCR